MALSVSANSGNGLANLFRQGRQAKVSDEGTGAAEPTATAVSLRPLGRSGIDSTGSGTAQMSAALTLYLSKLGGTAEAVDAAESQAAAGSRPAAPGRSGAADLMRTLDAYGSGALRLTA